MIKISVSDVIPTSIPLPVDSVQQALALDANEAIEFCPDRGEQWVKMNEWERNYHPFLMAAAKAFEDHRPLEITPDMIWLIISQGVGMHVSLYAEELRSKFVPFQGKEKIEIRRDDFVLGSPDNGWDGVVQEFTEALGKRSHLRWRNLMVPRFSTSGPKECLAFEVSYMAVMANYFEYQVTSMCGIPHIQLAGTVADWERVIDHVQGFRELGLEWWIDKMLPMLHKIRNSVAGESDNEFWKSFFKLNDKSGGPYISGWVTVFFPYVISNSWRDRLPTDADTASLWERAKKAFGFGRPSDPNQKRRLDRNRLLTANADSMLELCHFPSGDCKAPFVWKYLGKSLDMAFWAGFLGISQNPETLCLKPEIHWIVIHTQK